jgi:hypothetical protein
MAEPNMTRASLADIRRMKEKGELFHDPKAPDGEDLGPEFCARAEINNPRKPRSVHLKLDPEVFEFFYSETNEKRPSDADAGSAQSLYARPHAAVSGANVPTPSSIVEIILRPLVPRDFVADLVFQIAHVHVLRTGDACV